MPSAVVVIPARNVKKRRRSIVPSIASIPVTTLVTGGRLCQRRRRAKTCWPRPGGPRYDLAEHGGSGMNIFKALAVKDVDEATRAIPLIDVGPAFRGEPGAVEAAAQEICRACERVGFFYLAGHGVPQPLIDDVFAASREFHAIPLDSKAALKINENNIGYLVDLERGLDRKSTRLNSSHVRISYAVFCLKKKKNKQYFNSAIYP